MHKCCCSKLLSKIFGKKKECCCHGGDKKHDQTPQTPVNSSEVKVEGAEENK